MTSNKHNSVKNGRIQKTFFYFKASNLYSKTLQKRKARFKIALKRFKVEISSFKTKNNLEYDHL